jgi:hypothetical protein
MRILKICAGVASCALAVAFCLPAIEIVFVWLTGPHLNSIEIGDWTFTGWQMLPLVGAFAGLTVAFAYLALHAFRSSKTAA